MHAQTIVLRFLDQHVLMHAARRRLLAAAVSVVMGGHWIGVSHLGRGLAGTKRVKSAIKRVERLIGNSHRIHDEAQQVGAALMAQICRMTSTVVIAVDWSAASPGGAFVELRAGATWPGAGRTLPIYQRVYPVSHLGNPAIERELLKTLSAWVPAGIRVVVLTDAGFRRRWFAQVRRRHWFFVGRVRRGMGLSLGRRWWPAQDWFARATRYAQRFTDCRLSKNRPLVCDAVLYRRPPRHRRPHAHPHRYAPTSHEARARTRAHEPWLLVHSPELTEHFRPDEIVALYARRMQIEETFRDSKSPAFGLGFSIGRSRTAARLHALLLIATLAAFLLWHIGQLAEAEGLHRRFRQTTRVGREISIITLALLLCRSTDPPLPPHAILALQIRLAI